MYREELVKTQPEGAGEVGPAPSVAGGSGTGVIKPDSSRGRIPADFAALIGAYRRAHRELSAQSERDLTVAVGFLIQVLAEVFPPAAQALAEEARSRRPRAERRAQRLKRVPTSILRTLELGPLLTAPGLAAKLEVSEETLRQYRSRLLRLEAWFRTEYLGQPHRVGRLRTPEWIELVRQAESRTGRDNAGSRVVWLAVYCETQRLLPAALTTAHTEGFYHWLVNDSGMTGALTVYYQVGMDWKALAAAGAVPPVPFYRKPRKDTPYLLRADQAPAALWEPIETFERLAQSTNPQDWPTGRRLSANTLRVYRKAYSAVWGVARINGVDLEQCPVVAIYADPKYVEDLLGFLQARAEGKVREWHCQWLQMLRILGKEFIVPRYADGPVDLTWLDHQIARLGHSLPVREPVYITPGQLDAIIGLMEAEYDRRLAKKHALGSQLVMLRDLLVFMVLRDRANRGGDLWRAQLVAGPPPDPQLHDEVVRGYLSTTPPYSYKVFTKTRVLDHAPLPLAARSVFRAYLAVREEMGITTPWLLVTARGDRLFEGGLCNRVAFWANKGGVKMKGHDFRRIFVTSELAAHGDVEKVKALFGNKSDTVIHEAYDQFDALTASRLWNDHLEAHFTGSARALPLWVQELITRTGSDARVRRQLIAAHPQRKGAPS